MANKPNTDFNLTVEDIEMIENALRALQIKENSQAKKKEIIEVLAKIHHQKVFYRPEKNYVGG